MKPHGDRTASRDGSIGNVAGARAIRVDAPPPVPRRAYNGRGHYPITEGKRVDVTCWCERKTVRVTIEDVCAGRTASCGAAACKDPATRRDADAPHPARGASATNPGGC